IKESSLGLNYGWSYGETGWNSGMDENIVLTGFHANKQIKGILSTPPTTGVNNGDAYIVGSSPTGTWVGNYAKVAIYDRGSWLFATPISGVSVYNKANGCWYEYNNGWSLKSEAEESPYIKVKDFDFSTGYTITDSRQLLFYPTNQTYYQWNGTLPKVVSAGSTPATSGGISSTAWVDRTDLTLRGDLALPSGSAMSGYRTGTAEHALDNLHGSSVYLSDYPTLKDAINALPVFGGVVRVPVGRFLSGDWNYDNDYMSKANVTIVGEVMPKLSQNADRLEGGSVIDGRFNAFADNFTVINVGFDAGKYVMDTYYPTYDSLTANHPLGGTWDAFAFAQPNLVTPLSDRKNFTAINVIGLQSRPLSVGHSILIEGVNGGYVDNVIGVYGTHATVIKSQNIRGGVVSGWMASNNDVIFKSDSYANCGHIALNHIDARTVAPNCTPWSAPIPASHGWLLNPASADFTGPIQVGSVKGFGMTTGFNITGDSSHFVSDVQIGSALFDGYTGAMSAGVDYSICKARRVSIGCLIVNSALSAIAWNDADGSDNSSPQLSIGEATLTNLFVRAIAVQQFGRVKIDQLSITSAVNAYFIENDSRLIVGNETLVGVSNKWEINPPVLSSQWANTGSGNETFDVVLENYGVSLEGLITAQGTTGGVIATLPVYLRPTLTIRKIGYLNDGSIKSCLIGVDSGGSVYFNDNATTVAGSYISLHGIVWKNY
ncbi:MAG: DUF2793 domain-containing protein, partial [Prevotella sp.]